jgi:membrane-bound lytic murein transglycosylase D
VTKVHLTLIYVLLVLCLSLALFAVFSERQNLGEKLGFTTFSRGQKDSVALFELPAELSFAGEKVPLEQADVVERLERELYVNAYWESNLILLFKRSKKYLPEIERLLQEQGVPDDFKYLAIAESGLLNASSAAGAKGYCQILEDTGKEYGLEITESVDERYHLEQSTLAAAAYLKKAHQKFGDWTAVAASYNMGQSGFSKRQEEQLHRNYYDLYLNEETSRYLFRILAFKLLFENPEAFGYHLQDKDYYNLPEFREIEVTTDLPDLPVWAKEQGSSYKYLKRYNPWLRAQQLQIKTGKRYTVRLPLLEVAAEKN